MQDNLKLFFEKIKSLGFWRRVFGWKKIRILSYDAYDEFNGILQNINNLNLEISKRETSINELKKNNEISSLRISDLNSSAQKLESKLIIFENELSRLNR